MLTRFAASVLLLATAFPQSASPNPEFDKEMRDAKAALAAQDYATAGAAFKRANKLQGNHCSVCLVGLSRVAYASGSLDALDLSSKAIAAAETDAERAAAHAARGQILMAFAQREPAKLADAEREFRSALSFSPNDPWMHLQLATILLRQKHDADARPELERVLALKPPADLAKRAQQMLVDPRRGRETFLPEFTAVTIDGQQISSTQLGGKILVMDFWATWCPPCRESLPEIKELARKYPDRVTVISISDDRDEKAWRQFVEKKQMTWLQVRDVDGHFGRDFGIEAIPTYLVFDGEGILRAHIQGMNPQESVVHKLKMALPDVLAGNSGKADKQ